MATPGELVRAMAIALGISPATVTQFDRQLAESGLRSKGGRGTSAASVTALDAANLLTAIAGSPISGPSIKGAVTTCKTYGSLPELTRVSWTRNFKKAGLPSLGRLPQNHSFIEALAKLIDGVAKGELFKYPDFSFGITFDGPRPRAEISSSGPTGEYLRAEMARLVYWSESGPPSSRQGDLYQSRKITFATIRALGSLLSKEEV